MVEEVNSNKGSKPSRFLIRLLDRSQHIDYLFVFIIGAWPICLAYFIGAHKEIDGYAGYLDTANWWSLALLLPIILFVFRWVMGKIIPVVSPQLAKNNPPIINILHDVSAKKEVYDQLRQSILSKKNFFITLLIVVIVHVLDMWPIVSQYFTDTQPDRKDWGSMFQLNGSISKTNNFILLIFAYIGQFTATFIGTLTIILIFCHNLFFMRHIYQRQCINDVDYKNYFQIDVDDVNRCFGFRAANEAFNTQIKALMLAGLAMFLSRYAHVKGNECNITELFSKSPDLNCAASFTAAGQWLMALFWLIALFIVAMPSLVKLLPRMPHRGSDRIDLSVENYLREFFSDESWPKDKSGKDESTAIVAGKFARNSFWPTGDNRAHALFLFSYWIFFIILLPPLSFGFVTMLIIFVIYGVAAYLIKNATFWALKWALRYVDEILVIEKNDMPSGDLESNEVSDVSIFISYRRSDTAPYARSIHENLLEHFHKENIFIDREDIDPGVKFAQTIEKSLTKVDAIIALIGKEWTTLADEHGNPRIHDPEDMVRYEIATAIKLGKHVFPVLVDGATMPTEKELPDPLKELVQFNAIELSEHRWSYDMGLLVKALNSTA